jgi:excisionase family DNA binding protein
MADSLLSVAEVARLTLVPAAAVRGWVESGRLPSVPAPDGARLVRRIDLEAFVAANGMPPLPPAG